MRLSENLPLVWGLMVVIGLITFAYRLSFIMLLERVGVPAWLSRALRFVPVAALTAIITPELFIRSGALDLSPMNLKLMSGIVAILVAWRTRNTLLTIAAGMVSLWVLQTVAARLA